MMSFLVMIQPFNLKHISNSVIARVEVSLRGSQGIYYKSYTYGPADVRLMYLQFYMHNYNSFCTEHVQKEEVGCFISTANRNSFIKPFLSGIPFNIAKQ